MIHTVEEVENKIKKLEDTDVVKQWTLDLLKYEESKMTEKLMETEL